jgi:hypothetical protein
VNAVLLTVGQLIVGCQQLKGQGGDTTVINKVTIESDPPRPVDRPRNQQRHRDELPK